MSAQDVQDIDREGHNEQERRYKLFEVWQRRKGCDATYTVMITAFNEVMNRQCADRVKMLLSDIVQGRLYISHCMYHCNVCTIDLHR